ncbi:MAG: hypothetical protein ACR2L4_04820 [Actinomycetota bacterium]
MTDVAHTHAGYTHGARGRTIGAGALAGIVASVVMGMFAMIAAATYQGTGFFTPLYHIASPLIDGRPMMASMEAASGGNRFFLDVGPAILGLAIHMMVGAIWGIVFFVLVRLLGWTSPLTLVLGGVVFGLAVLLVMSWVTLPITAAVVGGGKPVEDMPQMVGWGTFAVEHGLFGLILGAWAAASAGSAGRHGADAAQP